MYKLLIVEDDDIIMEGLKTTINWGLYNIDLIGCASNGEEGYTLCKNKLPDIAIVDINIPEINGLELSKKMLEMNGNMKIIIITGMSSFELVHEAFRVDVFDYLLKPFKNYELIDILNRAKDLLDKIIDKNIIMEKAKSTFDAYLPQIREIFLNNIINGVICDEPEIIRSCNELGIETKDYIGCSMIIFDDGYKVNSDYLRTIQIIMERVFPPQYAFYTFLNGHRDLVIMTTSGKPDENLYEKLNMLRENILCYLNKGVSIVYGKTFTSFLEFKENYGHVARLMNYQYLHTEKIFGYGDAEVLDIAMEHADVPPIGNIMDCIKYGDTERLKSAIKEYLIENREYPDFLNKVKKDCVYILSELLRFCLEINVDIGFLIRNEQNLFIELLDLQDIHSIIGWLSDRLISISKSIHANKKNKTEKIISAMIEYINKNYHDNSLNAYQISSTFNISTGYLSTVFKQYTNKNLSDYINMVRIEKAKELLSNPVLKISEIAAKTGFGNHNYFSTIFKSYIGLSPSEYREINAP